MAINSSFEKSVNLVNWPIMHYIATSCVSLLARTPPHGDAWKMPKQPHLQEPDEDKQRLCSEFLLNVKTGHFISESVPIPASCVRTLFSSRPYSLWSWFRTFTEAFYSYFTIIHLSVHIMLIMLSVSLKYSLVLVNQVYRCCCRDI